MVRLGFFRSKKTCVSFMLVALAGCLLPQHARAGTGSITGTAAGATPFISNVAATFSGGTLQSVAYEILPKSGSFTRPLIASYPAQYLIATGLLNSSSNSVTIPVFGLYAGYTNTVYVYFYFIDGTESIQTISINTASYSDPCAPVNSPALTQHRVNTSDLNFDFLILKQNCSANNPTIVDTDGNIRWVGQANTATSSVAIYHNEIYLSDGKTGILGMPLTTATPTKIGDYAAAPYNVTFTGHHNIDPGRDGLIVDVNTSTQTEAVDLEINPNTGAVLNSWDLGQIISYTMTKGGDDPTKFVLGASADWFHNNATAYNPADNTLIVSSRENFVVAVDYDTPTDGQKKIHWILGDTSKAWYQYASLRALMLNPANSNTLPPIGQHAVSIDHNGNLLLFDDGYQSLTQVPAGNSRTYSAVREYIINNAAMTATAGPVYYSPNPTIFNGICGSVYDVNNSFLVDFPVAGAGTNFGASSNAILQGLGSAENLVFNLQYTQPSYCAVSWNAYPIPSNIFQFSGSAGTPSFNILAAPSTLTLVAPQSGQVAVNVAPQNGFAGPVALTATGFPAGVTYSFSTASTTTNATLSITAPPGTPIGMYPITITGTSGSLVSSFTISLAITAQTSAGQASVNLSPASNIYGIFNNGSPVTNGGLDTSSYAYSANLLGANLTFNGVSYSFGTPGSANAVSSATIALPSGNYTTLNFLGAAIYGNQPAQTFVVTYTDGTTSTFTQSISDWGSPQNYPGESIALTMPYRLISTGAQQASPFSLYAYSFTLNGAKTVKSLTLPNSRNVVVVAVTMSSGAGPTGIPVSLASAYNVYGSVNDGTAPASGGLDGAGYSYSTKLLGTSLTWSGVKFPLGAPGAANAVSGGAISLPAGTYATLKILATGVFGNQTNQPFVVNYSDGSTTSIVQSLSDWGSPQNNPGESIALTMAYRVAPDGSTPSIPFNLYGYSFALNTAKTVQSITLPNNRNVIVLSMVLVPSSSTPQQPQTINFPAIPAQTAGTSFTLSASASSGLPVTFTSSTTSVCTVSGTTAAVVAAGSCSIMASQSGNSTYAAAVPVVNSFAVNGAAQTISFPAISAQTAGTSLSLSATASSGLAVSFASSTTAVCTASGGTAAFINPGTCTITASQAGNAVYAAAVSVSQSFTVKPKATFTFSASATRVTVTPPTCFGAFCFGGASGTDRLTVTPANGFTGAVTFSVSGLPTGVTASFSPTTVTTSGSTTLTLTPSSSAARNATATLTITGTAANNVRASTTITLSY